MTLRFQLLILPVVLLAGCGADRQPLAPGPLPAWLTSLITDLESQPPANPPAFIARYEFTNDVVYFLPQRCCDIQSTVYRTDGAILCHPDGGITGSGDGRCPGFFAQRKNEEIVWRDARGATR
jgi:hypothetical protein